jgi:hypothetical protein
MESFYTSAGYIRGANVILPVCVDIQVAEQQRQFAIKQ